MQSASEIVFRIPGRLKGYSRPRFNAAQKRAFQDTKTALHQGMVRHFASLAMGGRPWLTPPLGIWVVSYFHTPKSLKRMAPLFRVGFPDPDNSLKLICDGMNKIVYEDDRYLAETHTRRVYNDDLPEHVIIKVKTLPNLRPFATALTAGRMQVLPPLQAKLPLLGAT